MFPKDVRQSDQFGFNELIDDIKLVSCHFEFFLENTVSATEAMFVDIFVGSWHLLPADIMQLLFGQISDSLIS